MVTDAPGLIKGQPQTLSEVVHLGIGHFDPGPVLDSDHHSIVGAVCFGHSRIRLVGDEARVELWCTEQCGPLLLATVEVAAVGVEVSHGDVGVAVRVKPLGCGDHVRKRLATRRAR